MDIFNSRYILGKKRSVWIDYDRGISIILVTYRHCFEGLTNSGVNLDAFPVFKLLDVFLFGFRMPLFFIASGIFMSASLNKKGLQAYLGNRVNTILYPLLVWGFMQITLQIVFSDYTNSHVEAISYLNLLINPRDAAQFWYLNALFFIAVIYSVLKVKLKVGTGMQIIIGVCLFLLSAFFHSRSINPGFLIDICEFYIFFALGDIVAKYVFTEKISKLFSSFKLFFILLPFFLVVQYTFMQVNLSHKDDYYVEHNLPLFFLFVATLGCTISINFSFLLQRFSAFKFLRVIGFHSLYIYCAQIIAMAIARMILINVAHITYPPVLVVTVWSMGILIPMIFYNLCLQLNMWWLFTFRKPENEINFRLRSKILNMNPALIEKKQNADD